MKVVQDAELENKNFPATSRRNINIFIDLFFPRCKDKTLRIVHPRVLLTQKGEWTVRIRC